MWTVESSKGTLLDVSWGREARAPMKLTKVRVFVLSLAVCVALGLGVASREVSPASPYPTKEVTYIVGWAPGSSTDRIARALADAASPHLGKPIIVKNIPGASGTVAAVQVAKSKPDGYTVFMMPSINLTIHPHVQDLPYRFDDFEILSLVWTNPYIWAVRPDSPYKTFDDLMADAKQRPGRVNYSHPGIGTAGHLAIEVFSRKTGIKLQLVPFKGGAAEGVIALLGGHVDSTLAGIADVITHIQEGRLRALAASIKFPGMERIPGLKSMKELSYDIEFAGTTGNALPKGTPKEIVERLRAAFKKGMEEKSFLEAVSKMQMIVTYKPGNEVAAQWKKDFETLGPVIKDLGLKQ